MVLVDTTTAASAGKDSSNCIVITGAGSDDANGVYVPTGKKWHDAEVYENDAKCLLSREPHKNNQTGETSYGWILGQDRKPLYAVQSSAIAPPTQGWRKFAGAMPLPQFNDPCSYADGASRVVESLKDSGKVLFTASKYSAAESRWTRALSLAGERDIALKATLYSNRSEVRLRLAKFDAALSDAQAALKLKPTHDKALLRAAVAAREMKMYGESYDFVQKCIELNPCHMDAKILLADLEYLIQDAMPQADMAKVARMKMEDSVKLHEEEQRGKKLGVKDVNMVCGIKAFKGYGDKREKLASASQDERPSLSCLPYHHVGLPEDQVKVMDKFFQEQRDKKDYANMKAKKEKENYAKVKEEYKSRAAEDVKEGRMAPLEEILGQKLVLSTSELAQLPPKAPSLVLATVKTKSGPTEKATLSASEMAEIDHLFAGVPTKPAHALVPATVPTDKRKQLEEVRMKLLQ